jgi:poly(A) polymerase
MTERDFATDVVRRLRAAGHQALWAGGCVRDMLLGREPDDFDVATDARPEQVQALFKRTVAVGVSFGVVQVLGPRPLAVEVATFRCDGSYSDGRHPDTVVFSSPKEDARRRDFTVNGMFFDPIEEEYIDYVGGRDDLQAGVLRAIGDPVQRFSEDKLRLLRAVRFATRFQLKLDPATAAAIRAMAGEITVVSAERIAEELRKLLSIPRRADGVRLLNDVSLLAALLPEVAATGDEWTHTQRMLELLPADASFPLALAALLNGSNRDTAARIGQRLKLSNSERDRIEWLVGMHEYLCDAPRMPNSLLKPVLAHAGIGELLALHRADALAASRSVEHVEFCEQKLREWPPEVLDPPPVLTGDDLLALGIEQGPIYNRLLDAVRAAQLDAAVTTKDDATELVLRLSKERAEPG